MIHSYQSLNEPKKKNSSSSSSSSSSIDTPPFTPSNTNRSTITAETIHSSAIE